MKRTVHNIFLFIQDFVNLEKGLADVGVGEEDKMEIFATIAAILHLGNIEFEVRFFNNY